MTEYFGFSHRSHVVKMEEVDTSKMPLIHQKPIADEEDLQEILREFYKLEVTAISTLESYYDMVYHVVTKGRAPSLTEEYVLKLYNHETSKKLEDLNEVIEIMVYLNHQGINCPKPLKNKNGDYIFLKELSKEELGITVFGTYAICLCSFIKGVELKKVDITDELLFRIGQYLAELHIFLKEVDFPVTRQIEFDWNFDRINERLEDKSFYEFVEEDEKRELISEAFNIFVRDVDSRKDELQKGVIHGDYNDGNILISSESVNGTFQNRIAGIIDFNDLNYNALVYDTAIGLLYMMLICSGDMLTAGGHFLAGYQSKRPLHAVEKEVIVKATAARLALSLVTGLASFSEDPDNLYLLETQEVGWPCLHMLLHKPEKEIWGKWNLIIKDYDKSLDIGM